MFILIYVLPSLDLLMTIINYQGYFQEVSDLVVLLLVNMKQIYQLLNWSTKFKLDITVMIE